MKLLIITLLITEIYAICTTDQCEIKIRKCCSKNYYFPKYALKCEKSKNSVSLDIQIYDNIKLVDKTDYRIIFVYPDVNKTRNIITAPIIPKFDWCKQSIVRIGLDEVLIQRSGELQFKNSGSANIEPLQFCVEYFGDLNDTATVICTGGEEDTFIEYSIGKYTYLLVIICKRVKKP